MVWWSVPALGKQQPFVSRSTTGSGSAFECPIWREYETNPKRKDRFAPVCLVYIGVSLSLFLRCGKEDKRDVEEGEKRREQGKWIGTRSKSVELILLAVFHLYFLVSRSESVLSTLEGRKRLDFPPFFQLKIWFLFRSFFNRALVYCSLVSFDSL